MSAAGLHLWEIDLVGNADTLWVTTRTRKISEATKKADAFLKKPGLYKDSVIKGVTHRGTIDA